MTNEKKEEVYLVIGLFAVLAFVAFMAADIADSWGESIKKIFGI